MDNISQRPYGQLSLILFFQSRSTIYQLIVEFVNKNFSEINDLKLEMQGPKGNFVLGKRVWPVPNILIIIFFFFKINVNNFVLVVLS